MSEDLLGEQSQSARVGERRQLLRRMGVAMVGAALVAPRLAQAQGRPGPVAPPSVITQPPRDFSPNGAPTTYFTDPDVLTVDPSFDGLRQPNAAIQRLWTGALWSEGPAWNSVGKFLVWSDIPNNRQMRWLEDDGHVSVFRSPSNNSNGNTFDYQGRQLSCEHLGRRVVRYELDGSATIIASMFNGKRLNSPNDVVPHTDGSYWFTDPPYGAQFYEGTVDDAGGPVPEGRLVGEVVDPAGQGPGAAGVRQQDPEPDGRRRQPAGPDLVQGFAERAGQGLAGEAGEVQRHLLLLEGGFEVRPKTDGA